MPVPAVPLEIPSDEDWKQCERILTALPDDYKAFLASYGTGVVDDFLWVFNPASKNTHLNLNAQIELILSALSQSERAFPEVFSMPRFPAANGFLPVAGTDNGDSLFWVVDGPKPNNWTIAVMGPRSPKVFSHNSGFVAFLRGLIRGDVHCDIFPSDFLRSPTVSFVATLG